MNLFILDEDLNKSIQYLPDKHVVKMPVESAQMLCAAFYAMQYPMEGLALYKATHLKHPCTIWTYSSRENWLWLQEYTMKLGEEYSYRYGGKQHKSVELIRNLPVPVEESKGLLPFVKCVPKELENLELIDAYRQFFIQYKGHLKQYTKREIPEWWV